MIFLKKTTVVPLVFSIVAVSTQVFADPVDHTVMLQATVPTTDFYVLPSESGWIGNVQELGYNANTSTLGSLKKSFDVKHSAGGITAQLTSSSILASSTDNIDLTVKFNGVELKTTSVEVVTQSQASAHSTANLEVIPNMPKGGYAPGKYTGSISMLFDAQIKGAPASSGF